MYTVQLPMAINIIGNKKRDILYLYYHLQGKDKFML
jgi:hypothetical protein